MSAEAFLDTNVLVYCFDPCEPEKQGRARDLVERALRDGGAEVCNGVHEG
jgi:predicted nucleic acid-binding protein